MYRANGRRLILAWTFGLRVLCILAVDPQATIRTIALVIRDILAMALVSYSRRILTNSLRDGTLKLTSRHECRCGMWTTVHPKRHRTHNCRLLNIAMTNHLFLSVTSSIPLSVTHSLSVPSAFLSHIFSTSNPASSSAVSS